MTKNVTERSRARKLISKLGLSRSVSNYFVESLTYCLKNEIGPADVVLIRDFYPINIGSYKSMKDEIETECRKNIHEVCDKSIGKFVGNLEYNGYSRLTTKKLLVLALIELYK